MATLDDSQARLQSLWKQADEAAYAGDEERARRLEAEARSLQSQLRGPTEGPALGAEPPQQSPLRGDRAAPPGPGRPDPWADAVEQESSPALMAESEQAAMARRARQEEEARGALDEIEDVNVGDLSFSDYAKSAYGDLMRLGGNFLTGFERRHMAQQFEQLERLRESPYIREGAFGKKLTGEEKEQALRKLGKEVGAGERQLDPTFYGTFIKPAFGDNLENWGQNLLDYSKEIWESRSDTARAAAETPLIIGRDAEFTKPETWFEGGVMPWDDPSRFAAGVAMLTAENSASLGASIISARTGGQLGAIGRARNLRRQGVINPEVVRRQASEAAGQTGTYAGMATEYAIVRDQLAQSTEEAIKATWDKQELWEANDEYRELVDSGYAPETAKQVITNSYAGLAGDVGGVTSAVLGAPMSRFFAKLGLDEAASRTGSAFKGAAGEAIQEGIQESTEQLYQNIAERQIDPSKPFTEGILQAFVSGGIVGGVIGGAGGALAGGDATETAFNKDVKKLKDSGFSEWRKTANERSKLQHKISDPEYIKTTPAQQRVEDFRQLEDLQYREAKAFLESEPTIRRMQRKYRSKAPELKRSDVFSARYKQTVQSIEQARERRATAEQEAATEAEIAAERDEMIRQVEADATRLESLRQQRSDIETIQEGGALSGEDIDARYESLQEAGYGRWANKARTRFVLTPAGRNARESIDAAIQSTEDKIEKGYAGPERRRNPELRARIDRMSDEELETELYTDPVTNIHNRRAYENAENEEGQAGAYSSIDADSLKWFNDNMGEKAGDDLLKKIARSGTRAGLRIYRTGGDEFVVRGQDPESLEEGMQNMRRILAKMDPVRGEGMSAQPTITWGIGPTMDEASKNMKAAKTARETTRERAARGEPPPSMRREEDPSGQMDLPLMSQRVDLDEAVASAIQEVSKLVNKTDEFSLRRAAKLQESLTRMINASEEADRTNALNSLRQRLNQRQPAPTAELAKNWLAADETFKAIYDRKAFEFYSPLAGEYVDGRDVYMLENGRGNLRSKLPSDRQDLAGNTVSYDQSPEFKQLNRLIEENRLPVEVLKSVREEARKHQDNGFDYITPAHVLSMRIHAYLGGEFLWNGPTPFSSDVDTFLRQYRAYLEDMLPLMMMNTDPVSEHNFYKPMKRGDRVEVIIGTESVVGTVMSSEPTSMVIEWEGDATVVDPDLRSRGKSARFSKEYGWQVSARMARGGMSYGKQAGSWPGQARLGRRWGATDQSWITPPKRFHNTVRKVNAGKLQYEVLRPGTRAKATRNEMRRARDVAANMFRGFRNMPSISLANTVADLPPHMQGKLAAHGSNGMGVVGMFDEIDPINGVWIMVGNAAQRAKGEGIPFEQMIAEGIAHETIGHYGLRGFMGDEERMNRWMDVIADSFPKEVRAKASGYGLLRYDPKTGKSNYISANHKRLAAEEFFAEIVQNVFVDGAPISEPKRNLLRRILDYIRTWMVDRGLGRFVRMGYRDLANLIYSAQNFAENAKGWEYKLKTGKTLVPYMRDADIFRAAVLREFYEGMRPATKEEKKQAKQKGFEPPVEVPIFPDVGMTKNAYIEGFKKLLSDNRITQAEYDYINIEGFLDDLTWSGAADLNNGYIHDLPENIRNQLAKWEEIANFDKAMAGDIIQALQQEIESAESLAGSSITSAVMDEQLLKDRRDRLDALVKKWPTEQEREEAQQKIREILDSKPGKKTKVPKEIVGAFLQKTALAVTVRPSQYGHDAVSLEVRQLAEQRGIDINDPENDRAIDRIRQEVRDRGVDITPQTWPNAIPDRTYYGRYVPFGVDRQTYGEYVFFQTSPNLSAMRSSHEMTGDMTSSFAHLRYAAAKMVDGIQAYEIIEVQSDIFQGLENAPTSDREAQEMRRRVKNNSAALSNMMVKVQKLLGTNLQRAMEKQYQENVARYAGLTREEQEGSDYDPNTAAAADVIEQWQPKIMERVAELNREIRSAVLLSADARLFDHLDRIALRDVLSQTMEVTDPLASRPGVMFYEDEVTKRISIPFQQVMQRLQGRPVEDIGPNNPWQRVVAKPELLKEYLNLTVAPLSGREFNDSGVKEIQSRLIKSAGNARVIIPKNQVSGIAEELSMDTVNAFFLDSSFIDRLRAAGLEVNSNHVNPRLTQGNDGDLHIEIIGYADNESLEIIKESVRIHLVERVEERARTLWRHREDERVHQAQHRLRRLQGEQGDAFDSSNPEALATALAELEFGDDHNNDFLDTFTYGDEIDENRLMELVSERVSEMEDEILGNSHMLREYVDFDALEDSDGVALDRQHPEYRALIEVDEDGDADTDEAEEWLERERREVAEQEVLEGGVHDSLYSDAMDRVYSDLQNDPAFTDNNERPVFTAYSVMVPVEWGADGEPVDFIYGGIYANAESNGELTDNIYIVLDGEQIDYWWDFRQAQRTLANEVQRYYDRNHITPPESSVFSRSAENIPDDLIEATQRREEPDFSAMKREAADAEVEASVEEAPAKTPQALWEKNIRDRRVSEMGRTFDTPLKKQWKNVVLKFAIADAVRKGFRKLVYQPGEASSSRGGGWRGGAHFHEFEYIDWRKTTITMGGKETEVFEIRMPDGDEVMIEPSRLIGFVGRDVANVLQSMAEKPQTIDFATQARRFLRVVDYGAGSVVWNSNTDEIVSSHDTPSEAGRALEEKIADMAASRDPEEKRMSRLSKQDIGKRIWIARTTTVGPYYQDTMVPESKLMGARTGYDEVTYNELNRIARRFGSKLVDGAKVPYGGDYSREDLARMIAEAVDTDNARPVFPDGVGPDKSHPNMRVEEIPGGRHVIVSDEGLVFERVYTSISQAHDDMAALVQDMYNRAIGIGVYEMEITDEMAEYFGAGNLPIMMQNPKDTDPVLREAAKKVGAEIRQVPLRDRYRDAVKRISDRINQGLFDRFHGIKAAMNISGWTGPAEQNPYIQARLTTGLDAQMRAVLNYGHPVWKDGIMQVEGKGLLDILQPVSDPEMLELWSLYMVGRRAKRLMDEGREHLFTPEEINSMLKIGNVSPEFDRVAQEYAEFNKKVLDFAEEAGIIDPDTRPLWEHADYVPFYRVMDERLTGPMNPNIGIAGQRSPIRQLKGGEAYLGDIPTNIIQNITNLLDASMKNHAALTAVDGLKGLGLIRKIPNVTFEQGMVPMAQVKQKLIDAGLNPQMLPKGALEGFQKMFVAKPPSGEGVVPIMRDGKREYYFTDDTLLYNAMTMINRKQWGQWMRLFRGPKRFLTAAVTLDPGFMLRNYIRDLAASYVQSRDVKSPATHIMRSMQGYAQSIGKSESLRTMMSAGAAFDSGYINYADPDSTNRAIRKAMRNRGFRQSLLDTPAKLYEFYKEFGAGFENANRVAVYNEALAAGKSKAQAAYEAKDLMDFSMHGSWPVVQFLVQSVPFMGARLQGLHRLGRGFVENPVAFAAKGLLITMAGMALWLRFKDDERYQRLEEWDKDTYYHFWIGDHHYRLPKPFEVGAIFNTIPERAFEYAWNESDDAERLLMKRFGHMLSETFAFNPMPQVAMPAFESAFNYNFFTGRSITSPYEEQRLPPEQFSYYTSPSMVEIARALPEGLDKISPKLRSPKHLENIYRGYMGTLGNYALQAADAATRHLLDYPDPPEWTLADYPVISSFYRGDEDRDAAQRTMYEEVFYDTLRKALNVKGSLSYLDRMELDDRMEYIERYYDPTIAVTPELENVRESVSKLNKDIMAVWMDPEMTPEAKRREVMELQRIKNEEFKFAYPLREGGSERPKKADPDDLTFMLKEFNVDDIPAKLREREAPETASLIEDILQLEPDNLVTLQR